MLKISVPDSAYSTQDVTLGGETYRFDFSYNSVDEVYRLDIYYQGDIMLAGIDLREGSILTGKYDLPNFDHGELFLAKLKASNQHPTRENIGTNKTYELIYVSNEELT